MSVRLMSKVWDSALDRNEKAIMLCLADFGNDAGESIYPSINYIHWKTGYSETAVKAILRQLRKKKYLTVGFEASKYGTNNYRINVPRLPTREPYRAPVVEQFSFDDLPEAEEVPQGEGGAKIDPPYIGGENRPQGGENRPQGGLKQTPGGAKIDPNTSVNPSVNPSNYIQRAGENGNGRVTDAVVKGDALDGILAFAGRDYSIEHFSVPTQAVIKKFCGLWQIDPPKSNSPDVAFWEVDAEGLIKQAGSEKAALYVLDDLDVRPFDWMKKVGISHPGALSKAFTARIGEIRKQRQTENPKEVVTPEMFSDVSKQIQAARAANGV